MLLIDDLEYARRGDAVEIFERYRQAFDRILLDEQKRRASVHFLVNMLEAYYFGDAAAINQVLGTCLNDYQDDVETIRHPKNDLKSIYPGFDEKRDGGNILDCLNVEHILSKSNTCASLRTLFLWCWSILKNHPGLEAEN
ncbi:DUF4276 family protein [bacterium]|nr:DUF4276 family protein [bacterium]